MIATNPEGESRQPANVASPAKRTFLWVFSVVMVITAGAAFIFKLIEFIYEFTRASNTVPGGEGVRPGFFFAIEPLITYLIVAAGFACMFLWAYFSGQYRDVEGPKYRMLEMQVRIDRAEAAARRK